MVSKSILPPIFLEFFNKRRVSSLEMEFLSKFYFFKIEMFYYNKTTLHYGNYEDSMLKI